MIKTILSLIIAGSVLASTVIAFPASANARHRDWRWGRGDHRSFHKNVRFIGHRRFFVNRPFVGGHYFPRRAVLIDNDFGNRMILSNSFTGPFSRNVNFVRFGLPHDDFVRISNNIEITNDIDIDASTGGNVVAFNTSVGSFRTGSINVDVDVDNL